MIPKFRAWHTPFKVKKFGQEMKYGRAGTLLSFAEMSPDDYILMQSTGLKDKNGVEIFDGDCFTKNFRTIEIPTGKDGIEKAVGIVKFHEGAFRVHIVGWGYELLSKVVKPQMYGANNDYWESEVIGNIYENPELLEEE